MQNDPHNSPLSKEALSRKHESENPAVGRILFVAGLVALLLIGSLAIIWALMVLLMRARPLDRTARERSVVTASNQQPLARFLAPHLQVDPHQDWVTLRAREDQELNTYGWIDRTAGVVRIPIERAMDLTLQRGLPVSSTNAIPKAAQSSLELIQERSKER